MSSCPATSPYANRTLFMHNATFDEAYSLFKSRLPDDGAETMLRFLDAVRGSLRERSLRYGSSVGRLCISTEFHPGTIIVTAIPGVHESKYGEFSLRYEEHWDDGPYTRTRAETIWFLGIENASSALKEHLARITSRRD